MRFFVTGASGLVGRHLVRAALARGDEVVALSRTTHTDSSGLHWVRGQARDVASWQNALDGVDAIVNLAGEPIAAGRWTLARQRSILESRVGITAALYHAIASAAHPPPVIVSASAAGYYGTDDAATFDETSPHGDGFLARVCREWESAAERCREYAERIVPARIGVVLAADGGMLPRVATPVRWFLGGALGDGQAWNSWIHIEDAVQMILWAIDTGIDGPLNLVAPQPVRQRELVSTIGRVVNRPVWLDAPGLALKLALGTLADEVLLRGQRVVPQRALALGYRFRYADLRSAIESCFSGARA